MRSANGFGTVVEHDGGIAIQFLNLHQPVKLRPTSSGQDVTEALKPYIGRVLNVVGVLPSTGGQTLSELELIPTDVQAPPDGDTWVEQSLMLNVVGNFGGEASENPSGDRLTVSIAYNDETGDDANWLNVCARKSYSVSKTIGACAKGDRVAVAGFANSYSYKSKPRVDLVLNSFEVLNSKPKEAVSLVSDPAVTQF